jgi:NTP pyrophosphatase (non-canonical NTP hydrolase)
MSNKSISDMLMEFHLATGCDSLSLRDWAELRKKLLREELDELCEAIDSFDPEQIAKEGSDLVYVVFGTMQRPQIRLEVAIEEVHKSNMSKIGPDGKFVEREDGKVLKGPNYRPPDLSKALTKSVMV